MFFFLNIKFVHLFSNIVPDTSSFNFFQWFSVKYRFACMGIIFRFYLRFLDFFYLKELYSYYLQILSTFILHLIFVYGTH